MKSSYIFTHCDGIDMVVLMPELFGGMGRRAWGAMSEGLIGQRDQDRRRGIWRDGIGFVVLPAQRYQGIVAKGGNNECRESSKIDVDCGVDVGMTEGRCSFTGARAPCLGCGNSWPSLELARDLVE
jgi:hypothetical protein